MPLAFPSLNHGAIAFGFFNIDTDLLLLEHYFLFAGDFCRDLARMALRAQEGSFETSWDGYSIDAPRDIGDLMGAIHGMRFTGFIGEVYKRFPFPPNEEDFKQKPEGRQNREILEKLIAGYSKKGTISVRCDADHESIAVAEYLFSREVFHQLIHYVWLGGYPRWRDGVRPDYVLEMKTNLERAAGWLTRGLVFS